MKNSYGDLQSWDNSNIPIRRYCVWWVIINKFWQVAAVQNEKTLTRVLPQGQIEETDKTLLDGLYRELDEEIWLLQSDLILFEDLNASVLRQMSKKPVSKEEFDTFKLHGMVWLKQIELFYLFTDITEPLKALDWVIDFKRLYEQELASVLTYPIEVHTAKQFLEEEWHKFIIERFSLDE